MKKIPRRDRCYLVSQRMVKIPPDRWAAAWEELSVRIERLSYFDVPKFQDLLREIRLATIKGKHETSVLQTQNRL